MNSQTKKYGNKTAIIADDQPLVIRLEKEILEYYFPGININSVTSGKDLVSLVDQIKGAADLVITDVSMEIPTAGIWAVKRIRRNGHQLPIILTSSRCTDETLHEYTMGEHAEMAGANYYVEKGKNDLLVAKARIILDAH